MAYIFNVDKVLLFVCLTYLPIIYVSSYQELSITNPKLCSLSGRKGKIKLNRQMEGVIIKETHTFTKWSAPYKFQCKFEVKDSENDRWVFSVIQKLRLRGSEDNCLDYVEFCTDDHFFSNERKVCKRICGETGALMGNSEVSIDGLLKYAFKSRGEMEVVISVADEKLLPNESLDLEIVFTSGIFKDDCGSLNSLIPCSSQFCIPKIFGNDSYVNCPFGDCRDEAGCPEFSVDTYHQNMSTTVTVGAITTVLACFLVFFACIWVLRHYNKLCWSSDFSGQREVRMTPVPPVPASGSPESLEAGTAIPMVHAHEELPTAPPIEDGEPKILHDKDLPPSYDSLFPTSSR